MRNWESEIVKIILTHIYKYPVRCILFLFLIFISCNISYAQNTGAYLIPRQIYVGDPASLILPLQAAPQNSEDIILVKNDSFSGSSNFPYDENIDFHRIILERRVTGSRLIIEFTAFVPGILWFPAIEIGGENFTSLSVTVGSLINDRSDRYLSGTASALAMPGTALMLYGSMAVIAVVILFAIWFIFKGRPVLRKLNENWKRYRLFARIRNTEKRLQKAIIKGTDKRVILDMLSEETRNFLSALTGKNCRAMTAREFNTLPFEFQAQKGNDFLAIKPGDFFRSCDEIRFSGTEFDSLDILQLLADLRQLIYELENTKGSINKITEIKAA
ncbi:MAG: hypothetical protein FWC06_01245 [Treponema sp.]|nr:hypothetical protein [Treponema sp.]